MVVGGHADGVDDFLARHERVLAGQPEFAVVVEEVARGRAGGGAGGAGADQGTEVEVFDCAGEAFAGARHVVDQAGESGVGLVERLDRVRGGFQVGREHRNVQVLH